MEFVAIEVYTNENATQDATSDSDEEESPSHPEDNTLSSSARPTSKRRRYRPSRLPAILEPSYLPPIADKNATFEMFRVVPDKGVFGGRHDGTIMHWKIQQTSSITPLNASFLRGHSGAILAMEFASFMGKDGLLFTGGADRRIKVWDPWRGSEAEQQLYGHRVDHYCIQTIPAHDSTITCLQVLTHPKHGFISGSIDRTIKIWYPTEGRGLLLYPWFVLSQTISLTHRSGHWPTALCLRDAATCSLYVGDSNGGLSHYACGLVVDQQDETSNQTFKLKRKPIQLHTLSIIQLQLIADDSLVVSLGFDHKVQLMDAMTGTVTLTLTNRHPVRFTACAWDEPSEFLFLSDASGWIQIYSLGQDQWIKKYLPYPSYLHPILSLSIDSIHNWMFLSIPHGMKQWKIHRDVGYMECMGHQDAIVSFIILPEEIWTACDQSQTTCARFLSASLDHTIRCWDAYDLKPVFGFEERQSSITCMTQSIKYNKILTGHEQGFIRSWGLHTGQYLTACLPSKSPVTCLVIGTILEQQFVMASDVDGNIFIWELTTDRLTFHAQFQASFEEEELKHEITALLIWKETGQKELLVIGYHTGHVTFWEVSTKRLVSHWKGHSETVNRMVRHGCFLFTASDDMRVCIWNCCHVIDPYLFGVLRSPGSFSSSSTEASIVGLDVVPETGAIICGATDGTIVVWDYKDYEDQQGTDPEATGRVLYRIRHDHVIRCIQYWSCQRSLLCGTNEGKILVFPLPSQVFQT